MTPAEAFSLPALRAAAKRASRGKVSRAAAAVFWMEEDRELIDLRRELLSGQWQPSPAWTLAIRDPKPRRIAVPAFRDRVVHQALATVLQPLAERRLIKDTYACRIGGGTHAAFRRARAWARTYRWVAHLDVRQFFPSIDHAIVRSHWRADHYPSWAFELCERILTRGESASGRQHFPGDDLFAPAARRVGLPLGTLTSQLWANRFLDPVDHHIKDRLRVRAYVRYMDDMLLFHHDRAALGEVTQAVKEECWKLRLRLHPFEVMPTADGVGFVGYRILPDHVRVRRTTVARAERRVATLLHDVRAGRATMEEAWDSIRSSFGHWDHADSWRLREHFLRRMGLLYDPAGAPIFEGRVPVEPPRSREEDPTGAG